MGELQETKGTMVNSLSALRNEASDALKALAEQITNSKREQEALRAEAERVVCELRDRISQSTSQSPWSAPTLPAPAHTPLPGPQSQPAT